MKRIFADLHLRLNPRDLISASRIVAKAASLGYSLIAAPFSPDNSAKDEEEIRKICHNVGVDFASRVDLHARTRDHLITQLRRTRRKYEVICVSCETKEIARQAAKDHRVDLLNLPSLDYTKRFFDKAEAKLVCDSLAALEIDIKPLYLLDRRARTRFFSTLRREVSTAKEFRIPVVLSSGVASEVLLRKPREMAALAGLFDLDESSALEAVSTNPFWIVKRNREKLSSGFVAPGVSVVKEGKDC